MANTKPVGVAYSDPELVAGTTITGAAINGSNIGSSATSTVGFFGATPITQPTNAAQAALTLTTATSGGFGFSTATAFNAAVAQLENIRASLVLLGLLKGS